MLGVRSVSDAEHPREGETGDESSASERVDMLA
jgi:hypothetical protein